MDVVVPKTNSCFTSDEMGPYPNIIKTICVRNINYFLRDYNTVYYNQRMLPCCATLFANQQTLTTCLAGFCNPLPKMSVGAVIIYFGRLSKELRDGVAILNLSWWYNEQDVTYETVFFESDNDTSPVGKGKRTREVKALKICAWYALISAGNVKKAGCLFFDSTKFVSFLCDPDYEPTTTLEDCFYPSALYRSRS